LFLRAFVGKFAFVETVTNSQMTSVASYARRRHQPSGWQNLPSKRAIAAITQDLLRLLFPGYFDEKLIHSSEIKVVRQLLDSVLGALEMKSAKAWNIIARDLPKKDAPAVAHRWRWNFLAACRASANFADGHGSRLRRRPGGEEQGRSASFRIRSSRRLPWQRLAHELYLKNVALIRDHDRVGACAHGMDLASGGNWIALFRGSWHRHGRRRNRPPLATT